MKNSIYIVVLLMTLMSDIYCSDRHALLIGNSQYKEVGLLYNPGNDVKGLGETLKLMGYDVTIKENLGFHDFIRELDVFRKKNVRNISLIYYSGHGVQINGVDYLVPIDFIEQGKLVEMNDLVLSTRNYSEYGVAIFDACRNNPFVEMITDKHVKDISIESLNSIDYFSKSSKEITSGNVFIGYATKDGEVALDSAGEHFSPFAKALMNHMPDNRKDIFSVFSNVRDEVINETGNKQEPYNYSSLGQSKLYLSDVPLLKRFDNIGIAVSVNEITVKEYLQCVKEKSCKPPEWLYPNSKYHIATGISNAYKTLNAGDQPIVGVNWYDAIAYTKWLNKKTKKKFRLLSDREWLSMAGKNADITQVNCDGCNKIYGGVSTSPVSSFANLNGLYDMFGNVWEWVCSSDNGCLCENDNCGNPILRGGSWRSSPHVIHNNEYLTPPRIARDVNIGFRIALNL